MFKKMMFALVVAGSVTGVLATDANEKIVRDAVQSLAPDIHVDSISPAPFAGFYQVLASGRLVYVSADGKYMLNGSVIDVAGKQDLTARTWAGLRKTELARLDASHMLVYGAEKPKYTVTVFTDVDCGYCRELHKHVADFAKAGIAMNYVFWPRTGIKTTAGNDTPSYTRAVAVWCAADRKSTFDKAISGGDVGTASCKNPVADDFALGERMGVTGTPSIYLADGTQVGGYVTPAQLLALIAKNKAGLDVNDE